MALTNVLLNLWLIPFYSWRGAAGASLATDSPADRSRPKSPGDSEAKLKPRSSRIHDVFIVLCFLTLMSRSFAIVTRYIDDGSFDGMTSVDPAELTANVADENPLGQSLWIMIYGVTAVLIAVNFPRFFNVVRKDKLLLLLNLLGMISVSWSEDPWRSARNGLGLFLTYAFGSYVACRYTERQFLDVFGASAFCCCLISLALGIFVPRLGVMSDLRGSWRGMFVDKNILGRFMALSALGLLVLRLRGGVRPWLPCAGLVLAIMLLYLSRSMTSVVMLVSAVALFAVSWWIRGRPTLAVVVALALAAGCVGLIWAWDVVGVLASLLDRDPTLTGRTPLWELLLELVWDRPWLGYGYDAFWSGDKGKYVNLALRWRVAHAHNGSLNVLLDFGSIGLLLLVVHFARCGVRAFVRIQTDPGAGPERIFWLILFLVIFIMNFSEPSLIIKNDFIWVMYIVMSHNVASEI